MAYSTQNVYQMFDIIPNFIRKMFPLSLKTYPSCTNTMAWDIRDEIRSAYILKMVHQRDNQKAIIDGNEKDIVSFNTVKGDSGCKSEQLPIGIELVYSSKLSIPSSRSEHLLSITNISNEQSTLKSVEAFPKTLPKGQNNRTQSQQKSIYRKSYRSSKDKSQDFNSSLCETRRSSSPIQSSTSDTDSKQKNFSGNLQNSVASKSTVQREYQLLAQKFHQYTINCRATIITLEEKLKKLIDDKHTLLKGIGSLRKGQRHVVKKYRKIFNDAMNEHCNEINALLANYRIIRDKYLELLQQDTSPTNTNRNDEVLSVSYTSYNC